MGFQFNHVGGGTKTRRPITLHMKYNAACVQPNCFLITEDYGEQEVTLEELQVSSAAACASCTCTDSALLAVAPSSFEVVQPKVMLSSCWPVLQDYIESENARLEREQQFWAKEIVVKIEYKFCPNLTIIDTPGESS